MAVIRLKIYLSFLLITLQLSAPLAAAQSADLALTADELRWIEAHPVIRAHNEADYAPFNFTVDGEPRGFAIDYMNLVAAKAGLRVEYVTGPSWQEFMDMIRAEELDVMINVAPLPEREAFMHFTDVYFQSPSVVVQRVADESFSSLQDLARRRVAVVEGYYHQDYMGREVPAADLLLTEDNLAALFAVLDGRAEAMLGSSHVTYLMSENSLTGLKVTLVTNAPELKSTNALGVRSGAPILRDILQKSMDWQSWRKRRRWSGMRSRTCANAASRWYHSSRTSRTRIANISWASTTLRPGARPERFWAALPADKRARWSLS